jgi:hypothetical protein
VETLLRRKRQGSTRSTRVWMEGVAEKNGVGGGTGRAEGSPRRWKEWDNAPRMVSTDKRTSISPEGSLPGEAGPTGFGQRMHDAFAVVLETGIEWLVRFSGRKVPKAEAPWLDCVVGKPGLIGSRIYQRIAETRHLEVSTPRNAGLVTDFKLLRGPSCDPDQVHPRIRHFYEHAAAYHLEVWSEVYLAGRFFLWLLVEFISRRMNQLNFPISSLEVAKGMTSEVVQLREPTSGRLVYTGWLRRFKSNGKVIFAGIYSETKLPGEATPCVKVTFPCRGSANVYLRPCSYADGSFGLVSTGGAFGSSGFYRLVEAGEDAWRVRNFKTLHEVFHVYVDKEDVLRTDHTISFVGLTILRLHYKMTLAENARESERAGNEVSLQSQ